MIYFLLIIFAKLNEFTFYENNILNIETFFKKQKEICLSNIQKYKYAIENLKSNNDSKSAILQAYADYMIHYYETYILHTITHILKGNLNLINDFNRYLDSYELYRDVFLENQLNFIKIYHI